MTAVVDCVTLGAGSKVIQGVKLATRLATTFGRMTLTNVTLAYGSKFATDAMQNLGCSPEVIMLTHALAGAAAIGVKKYTQNLIDNLVRDAGLRSTKELGDILKYKNMKPRELESLLKSLDMDDILGLSEHTMQFLRKETGMTSDAILKELEKGNMSIRGVKPNDIEDLLGELKKGASGAKNSVDDIIIDGSHYVDGKLKPNSTYKAGEHDYIYKTNEDGLISNAQTDKLQLKTHDGRLKHNANTPGKIDGDHAGHLFGDRFGGSPELDNLVSQAEKVNLSEYKIIENRWAKAIENGQDVTNVNIDVHYMKGSPRPNSFDISYEIDGVPYFQTIDQ